MGCCASNSGYVTVPPLPHNFVAPAGWYIGFDDTGSLTCTLQPQEFHDATVDIDAPINIVHVGLNLKDLNLHLMNGELLMMGDPKLIRAVYGSKESTIQYRVEQLCPGAKPGLKPGCPRFILFGGGIMHDWFSVDKKGGIQESGPPVLPFQAVCLAETREFWGGKNASTLFEEPSMFRFQFHC